MRGEPAYQRPFTAEESAKHIFGQTAELVRVLQWRYWYSYTFNTLKKQRALEKFSYSCIYNSALIWIKSDDMDGPGR